MTGARYPAALAVVLACVARVAAADPAVVATVEKTDGTTVSGTLTAISPAAVHLGGMEPFDVAAVRRLTVDGDRAEGSVTVACSDGSTLSGNDFTWDGGPALLTSNGGRVELPVQRVRSVTLRPPRTTAAGPPPDWLETLPESPQTDLVVVGKPEADGERLDVVECAIATVTADSVTVVLDDERIPVKRAKVIGLWFLREPAPAGGTRLEVVGGGLAARTMSWTPQEMVVDEVVRLPAGMLRVVDYAAGRTVQLRGIEPERVETEPFFGGLGRMAELKPFFEPRFVGAGAGTLVLRPRSHVVWRVPADARRFRTAVAVEPGMPPAGDVVTMLLDDREVFRRRIEDVAASPVDVDVAGGRRLAIRVEFPAGGGIGCPLRFSAPVFEK